MPCAAIESFICSLTCFSQWIFKVGIIQQTVHIKKLGSKSISLKMTQCQGWNSNLALTPNLLKPLWLYIQSWLHGCETGLVSQGPTLRLILSCCSLEILVISDHGPHIFVLHWAPQICSCSCLYHRFCCEETPKFISTSLAFSYWEEFRI